VGDMWRDGKYFEQDDWEPDPIWCPNCGAVVTTTPDWETMQFWSGDPEATEPEEEVAITYTCQECSHRWVI
jgi:DNA-directed RNA polymerase subunit M/transcription elongation factor TFIIS